MQEIFVSLNSVCGTGGKDDVVSERSQKSALIVLQEHGTTVFLAASLSALVLLLRLTMSIAHFFPES